MEKVVKAVNRLRGTIIIPPDKSIAHRAALFSAIGSHNAELLNYPKAGDPRSTLHCLEQLGITVTRREDRVTIEGKGKQGLTTPAETIDCGNSGTTLRLLTGLLAGAGIPCKLSGDESLRRRTMKRIIEPLRMMGLAVEAREDAFAPLEITRAMPVKSIRYELPVASAQVKSCVLLAGLYGAEPTRVVEILPTRNHTEQMLELDVQVRGDKRIISSSDQVIVPDQSMRIPGDFSSAAFWIVAACIHPDADVTLKGVGINPSRTAMLHVLERMGADIRMNNKRTEGKEPVADIRVVSSRLQATQLHAEEVPNAIDELPILAVAMACAEGTSQLRNAAELRHKETDRITVINRILTQAGVELQEYEDGLSITGNPDRAFDSFTADSEGDHRMAMAAAVMGLCSSGSVQISRAEAADISYQGFWKDAEELTSD